MIVTKGQLIQSLYNSGILTSIELIKAFEKVDRVDFVTANNLINAYQDNALPIGYGQTISQPTTVAFMLEKLQLSAGEKVLDIGSGSGWTTALIAHIVGSEGEVIGVERVPELVEFGKKNLEKYAFNNAKIICAGDTLGFAEKGPYDKVLVSASARSVPVDLIKQLKLGGVLVTPVRNSIYKITRVSEESYEKEEHYGFIFVPLIHQ